MHIDRFKTGTMGLPPDLPVTLDEAIARHDIEWKWVKGHDGNPGNEEADALANRGIDEL